jgi:hypothetical protein
LIVRWLTNVDIMGAFAGYKEPLAYHTLGSLRHSFADDGDLMLGQPPTGVHGPVMLGLEMLTHSIDAAADVLTAYDGRTEQPVGIYGQARNRALHVAGEDQLLGLPHDAGPRGDGALDLLGRGSRDTVVGML